MTLRPILFLVPALALAGCVGPASAPSPPPSPRPVPAPVPRAPNPVPTAAAWEDRPATPGSWVYRTDARGSIALFGAAGQDALTTVRCDAASRRLFVSVRGTVAGALTLTATTAAKTYSARPAGGTQSYVAAEISPADPQLDAIAFSRGHFLVSLAGAADLVLPSWPEFARIIEDCRG